MNLFDFGCSKKWFVCSIVCAVLWLTAAIAGLLHYVFFYPVYHFAYLPLAAAALLLSCCFFSRGSRIPGILSVIAAAGILLPAALSGSPEPEQFTGTLPDSGHTFTAARLDLKTNPNMDSLIVNEILIPGVLARQYSVPVSASGNPLSAMLTAETDEAGCLLLMWDGRCCMKYTPGSGWEPNM